ncbi:MAG: hypothetical protein E6G14_10920 [Actinobacteria bacterium]|nr:MAG: hypothetical protein E6G14_10920 [Actinomycetota bacterium]
MSSERSAELALRLWQAFRSRDWDQVTALVHLVAGRHDVAAFRFRDGRLVSMRYHATAAEARATAA